MMRRDAAAVVPGEALDQRHRAVTCELWDRADLDAPGIALSADRKRRLIAPDWEPT